MSGQKGDSGEHQAAFGLIGLSCSLELTLEKIKVYPRDGLKKRVRFVEEKMNIEVATAEIQTVTLDRSDKSLEFRMADSTGIVKTIQMTITGLERGEYRVGSGDSAQRVTASDSLKVAVPLRVGETKTIRKA